jgi:hypothetical protein
MSGTSAYGNPHIRATRWPSNELTHLEITPSYPELAGSVSVDLMGNYQPDDFVFDGRTVTLGDGGDLWGA